MSGSNLTGGFAYFTRSGLSLAGSAAPADTSPAPPPVAPARLPPQSAEDAPAPPPRELRWRKTKDLVGPVLAVDIWVLPVSYFLFF